MIGIIVVMRATNEKNVREKKKKWERKCGKSLGMQKKKKRESESKINGITSVKLSEYTGGVMHSHHSSGKLLLHDCYFH